MKTDFYCLESGLPSFFSLGEGDLTVSFCREIFSRHATILAPVLNTVQNCFYPNSEINTRELGGEEVVFEGETKDYVLDR